VSPVPRLRIGDRAPIREEIAMNRPRVMEIGVVVVLAGALVTGGALAQSPTPPAGSGPPAPMGPGMMPHHPMSSGPMPHGAMPHGPITSPAAIDEPTLSGQDAFGAISEIVRILDADPQTDWSQVDLERLRQHLIDMNEVVLRAEVRASSAPGGLVMDVTGTGRTETAIRAMLIPHTEELDQMPRVAAKTEAIPGGVRLTVTARDAEDAKATARVRGLGFIGLLTLGAHHQPHHLAMARGQGMPGHGH
jgi:hypothetical protein